MKLLYFAVFSILVLLGYAVFVTKNTLEPENVTYSKSKSHLDLKNMVYDGESEVKGGQDDYVIKHDNLIFSVKSIDMNNDISECSVRDEESNKTLRKKTSGICDFNISDEFNKKYKNCELSGFAHIAFSFPVVTENGTLSVKYLHDYIESNSTSGFAIYRCTY